MESVVVKQSQEGPEWGKSVDLEWAAWVKISALSPNSFMTLNKSLPLSRPQKMRITRIPLSLG